MLHVYYRIIAIILTLSVSTTWGQKDSPFTIVKLTDNIFQLSTDEGNYTTNSLVYVGSDEILLVDCNAVGYAEELKSIIDSYNKGIPKYIINTHRHVEHIGGNAIFGESPTTIAHYLLPSKLTSGSYIFNEFPKATYPDILVYDSLVLNFNGEKIRIINLGGSHDDNEIIVHFTKSKIVHLSSLCNGLNFPSIDSDGDLNMFPVLIQKAIDLLPEDVTIVSGHNNNCMWKDLHGYRDMLIETNAIVKQGIAEGKDVKTMQEEKVFSQFEQYNKSYVSTDEWISYNYDVLTADPNEVTKKYIFKPIYYALKDGGLEKALETYYDLKQNKAEEYVLEEVPLVVIGSKLLESGNYEQAIGMLKLSRTEFPDGIYAYYAHYLISKGYIELSDKENALKHCNLSVALNKDFSGAEKLLTKINNM